MATQSMWRQDWVQYTGSLDVFSWIVSPQKTGWNPDLQAPHKMTLLGNKMAVDVEVRLHKIVSPGSSGILLFFFFFCTLNKRTQTQRDSQGRRPWTEGDKDQSAVAGTEEWGQGRMAGPYQQQAEGWLFLPSSRSHHPALNFWPLDYISEGKHFCYFKSRVLLYLLQQTHIISVSWGRLCIKISYRWMAEWKKGQIEGF